MTNTSFKTTVEWNAIPWQKLERKVFKLQKRIYRASGRGDVKTVRKLQKTLIKSWSAKCLAVRRVTQDNKGKKTAGVDGVKSLTPKQRIALVNQLRMNHKTKPTRRIWIPKPGKEEKRPLGIPTLHDRAMQALVKLALEPEWEARFEPNNFGFRPGRNCHDAVEAIFNSIKQKAKYVLDADIAKCFDSINHQKLLEKINSYPSINRLIKAWLKSGVIDKKQFFKTYEGTPQGGVLSPLLANIALHGLENRIRQEFPKLGKQNRETWFHKKGEEFNPPGVVRYADDFIVMHENLSVIKKCREIITEWLAEIGLELQPSKTRIVHTFLSHEGEKPGFDFLGFNIRQHQVGKNQSGKDSKGNRLGFKTIITPSKESQKRHFRVIAETVDSLKAASQSKVINALNPIIRGWSNFYSTVVSRDTFEKLSHLTFWKLKRWAKRRHPRKSNQWIEAKYWQTQGNDNWVFVPKGDENQRLYRHTYTKIQRHVKVRGETSPFDGNWVYWSSRIGNHPEKPMRITKLLKQQKGKCAHCNLYFSDNDLMEVDHIIPKSQGGKNEYNNFQILHRHCHDRKTNHELQGTYDRSHTTEEPDDAKVSRPVLKTS
ncbi:group II intron reverse transcriptase/maturase [Nostoc sp. 2RC]|jgi:RNA-directed DNA polymerase|uniref:group II intron reverse transcriptase/maturase n=1 Tax=Nostoc sp. 2RC TaxID=2485484 RepID=UPI001625E6D9|nr:group II intron reverse transcriptase/maturase [Nostoc sp. 2RC]MBC1242057.1 group II intron reverse transcriptase/maturase [Nostoc sp. 2RC]